MFRKIQILAFVALLAYIAILEVRLASLKARHADVKADYTVCSSKLVDSVNYNNELNKVLEKQSKLISDMSAESLKKLEEYNKNNALSDSLMNIMKQEAKSCETLNDKIRKMGEVDYESL